MLATMLLAVVLAAGAAPDAARAEALRAEAKRFEGVWVCKAARVWGQPIHRAEGLTWEFRADTESNHGGAAPPAGALVLDEQAHVPGIKDPHYVRQHVTVDPSTEPKKFDVPHMRIEGIYRFTPEGLEICESPLWWRPRSFSGEKDRDGGGLYVLVRQTPKPKGDGGPEKTPAAKPR
jgi:hypothetical protein